MWLKVRSDGTLDSRKQSGGLFEHSGEGDPGGGETELFLICDEGVPVLHGAALRAFVPKPVRGDSLIMQGGIFISQFTFVVSFV